MGYIIKFNTPPEIREKIERKMQEMAKKCDSNILKKFIEKYGEHLTKKISVPEGIKVEIIEDKRRDKIHGDYSGKFGKLTYEDVEVTNPDGSINLEWTHEMIHTPKIFLLGKKEKPTKRFIYGFECEWSHTSATDKWVFEVIRKKDHKIVGSKTVYGQKKAKKLQKLFDKGRMSRYKPRQHTARHYNLFAEHQRKIQEYYLELATMIEESNYFNPNESWEFSREPEPHRVEGGKVFDWYEEDLEVITVHYTTIGNSMICTGELAKDDEWTWKEEEVTCDECLKRLNSRYKDGDDDENIAVWDNDEDEIGRG